MRVVAAKPDRRTQLLDATLALIAQGGLEAVTHRAVEAEAGVPHGSTTYYFKTRRQLIDAAVERLAEIDHAAVAGISHEVAMTLAAGRGELDYDRIAAGITAWIRARPDVQLMRYELYLAGARRPEIAARMRESRQLFVRLMVPVAVAAGSPEPERDAEMMLTLLNGLIFDELTSREPGHEPAIDPLALRRIIATVAVR